MAKSKKQEEVVEDFDFPQDVLSSNSLKSTLNEFVSYILADEEVDLDYIASIRKIYSFCDKFFKDERIKVMILENCVDGQELDWGGVMNIKSRNNFDYETSGHPEYNEIVEIIDKLTVRKKELEKVLSGIPEPTIDPKTNKLKNKKVPMTIFQTLKLETQENGEVVDVARPANKKTDYVQFTFK